VGGFPQVTDATVDVATDLPAVQAHYSFDETSGNRSDDGANAITLTDNNTVTHSAGNKGGAAKFTVANSEYLSTTDTDLLGNADRTYAFWVKPTANGTNRLLLYNTYATNGVNGIITALEYNAAGYRMRFAQYVGTGTDKDFTHTGDSFAYDEWALVVWTYDISAGTVKFYHNGVLIHTETGFNTSIDTSPTSSIFGMDGNFGTTYYNGLWGKSGIWHSVLTDAQIRTFYNDGFGLWYDAPTQISSSPLEEGASSLWEMEETSGSRTDSIGTNTLTDVNTVGSATGKMGSYASDHIRANREILTAADDASLTFAGDNFTLNFWVNLSGTDNQQDVLAKFTVAGGNREWLLRLDVTSGNFVFFHATAGGSAATLSLSQAVTFTTGQWDYYTLVRNGGTLTLYQNGKYIGEDSTISTDVIYNGTSDFSIGGSQPGDQTGGSQNCLFNWGNCLHNYRCRRRLHLNRTNNGVSKRFENGGSSRKFHPYRHCRTI